MGNWKISEPHTRGRLSFILRAFLMLGLAGCGTPTPVPNPTPNAAPFVNRNDAFTNEDTPVVVNVLDNDSDPDGQINPGSVTITIPPAHGTTQIDAATGQITYSPNANFNGEDIFTYQVCDNDATPLCGTATVNVFITAVNDAPVAANDTLVTNEDTPADVAVLANDSDADGPLSATGLSISAAPAHGTAQINLATGQITYTPAHNYNGPDAFTYQICDNGTPQLCASASVNITVNPVNDPPVAVADTATLDEDSQVVINVLANDSDPDSPLNPASVTVTIAPQHGSTTINPAIGEITYIPTGDFNGPDSFTYQICDNAVPALCATAVVSITVNPVNDPPSAAPDAADITEDAAPNTVTGNVLANDTDIDSTLTVASVNVTPANVGVAVAGTFGSVVINADGSFTYTLNNALPSVQALAPGDTVQDSFTYANTDGAASASSTLTISIHGANDAPVASNDSADVTEDAAQNTATGNVLSNDTDVDNNDTRTVTQVNNDVDNVAHPLAGSFGSFTLNADGTFTYTLDNANPQVNALNAGGTLTDAFTYVVSDSHGGSATASVTITIHGHNDAPVAAADANTAVEDGGPVNGNVLTNDTDVDNPTLTVASVNAAPANVGVPVAGLYGQVTINANGAYTYTLNNALPAVQSLGLGQTLSDVFNYTASDGSLASNTAMLTITINGANDAPVATADGPFAITNGATLNISAPGLLANDSDIDTGDTLTAILDTPPALAASFTVNPNGSFTYTHNNSGAGNDSFSYHARDSHNAVSNTIVVSITIQTGPAANDDQYTTLANTPLNINAAAGVIQGNSPGAVADTGSPTPTLTHYGPVGGPLATTPGNPFVTAGGATLNMSANGAFTYAPAANFSGVDHFDYEITNPAGVDTATVTITVNKLPVANEDNPGATYTIILGNTLTRPAGDLFANHGAGADDLGFPAATISSFGPTTGTETLAGQPGSTSGSAGLTVNANGSFVYTPTATGVHTFVYTLANTVGSDTAVVTITVNKPPTANDDNPGASYTLLLGGSLSRPAGDLFADHGAGADDLGFPVATIASFGPATGSETPAGQAGSTTGGTGLVVNANGSFNYTPTTTGIHTFVYRLSNSVGSDTATVTITVNKIPIANDDNPGAAYTIQFGNTLTRPAADLFANHGAGADDLGFPVATITSFGPSTGAETPAGQPGSTTGGSGLTVNANGSFTYTPTTPGVHTFVYTLANAVGSDTAVVTISSTQAPAAVDDPPGGIPANSTPPSGANPNPYHTAINTVLNIPVGANGLLANDTIGSPVASIVSFGPSTGLETTVASNTDGATASGGTLRVRADGSFTYTPASNFTGLDQFKYSLSNGVNPATVATVSLAVGFRLAVADDTHAVTGNIAIDTSLAPAFSVTSNDSGDQLAIALVGATHGTAVLNPNGTFTFDPDAGYTGPATITYSATNGYGSSQATVNLTVSNLVWFVDNSLLATGDGRRTNPFNSLADAAAAPVGTVFVYRHAGSYTAGYTLRASERLIGQGVAFDATALGFTPAPHSANLPTQSIAPTLTSTVTLANNSAVRGLNVTTTGATALAGSNAIGLDVASVLLNATTASALSLTNCSGSVAIFSTTVTNSPTAGVALANNSATISVGALNVTNTSSNQPGLVATDSSGTITVSSGALSTGTATAINIDGPPARTPLAISLTSITSIGGSAPGLLLTDISGTFSIIGAAGANSGGTIQNKTTDGVRLLNVSGVTLTKLLVSNSTDNNVDATNASGLRLSGVTLDQSGNDNFRGNSMTNLVLSDSCLVDRSGTLPGIHGINIEGLFGSGNSITATTIRRSSAIQLRVHSVIASAAIPAAPQDILTLSGCTFDQHTGMFAQDSVLFSVDSGANARLVTDASVGPVNIADGIAGIHCTGTTGARLDARVSNINRTGGTGAGVTLTPTGSSGAGPTTITFNISNNTITNAAGGPLNFFASAGGAIVGIADNNTLTGSPSNSAINLVAEGSGPASSAIATATISNNNITGVQIGSGINCQARTGGAANLNILNNHININDAQNQEGIAVQSGSTNAGEGNSTVCLNLAGNRSTVGPASGQEDYRLTVRGPSVFRLQGFTGNGANFAEVSSWLVNVKDNKRFDGSAPTSQISIFTAGVYTQAPVNCSVP